MSQSKFLLRGEVPGRSRAARDFCLSARRIALVALASFGSSGTYAANLTVLPGVTGLNVPSAGVGLHTSVYANQWKNTALPGKVSAAGVKLLRYPGGSYADGFHFSSPSSSYGYLAPGSDFASFSAVLGSVGATGMVTVNYGSSIGNSVGGAPQEAAAWVAYANAATNNRTTIGTDATGRNWFNAAYWAGLRAATPLAVDDGLNYLRIGRSAPIGIKYWEVGNEIFGNGYYGTNLAWENDKHSTNTGTGRVGDPVLSPAAYGTNFVTFNNLMKAVDPSIKVGAVLTGPGDTGDVSDPAKNWNRNVLLNAGTALDFGVIHYYPTNVNTNPNQLLASPRTAMPATVSRVRSDIQTYAGRDPATVELHMSEFGNFGDTPTADVRAGYVAQVYAAALSGGYASAEFLEMSSGGFLSDTATLTPGGSYFGMQVASTVVGNGGTFIAASSDTSSLVAYATIEQNNAMGILLLNQSQLSAETVNIKIPGPPSLYAGTLYMGSGSVVTSAAVSGLSSFGFSVTVPPNGVYSYVLTRSALSVPEPSLAGVLSIMGGVVMLRRRSPAR